MTDTDVGIYHRPIWIDVLKNVISGKTKEVIGVALAEMMGTAILVGLGCGSTVTGIQSSEGHNSHLNTVLSFGLALTVAITVFGHISGGHVNPAVSLSALIQGYLPLPRFFIYTASQCVGSSLAIVVLKCLSIGSVEDAFCVNSPSPDVGVWRAMLVEAVLTGVLVLICSAIWDRRCQHMQDSVAFKIGLGVVALALPGVKYSCSINPARSFGPALLSGYWLHHWVFWVGPMCGSAIASLAYIAFFSEVNQVSIQVPTEPEEPPEEEIIPL